MKLALIRRHFAATGGAELYTQRLCEALVREGHEVHLFAETWPAALAEKGGAGFHSVPVSGRRAQRPWRFAQAVQAELSRHSFDCVFSLERTLGQDVYRAGDGLHRVWLERRRAAAPWWKKWWVGRGGFHRCMLRLEAQVFHPGHTGQVIVNSEMVRQEILAHFPFPAERIHLVRNGVEVERFQKGNRALFRQRWHIAPEAFVLLFAGSGWERKGLPWVLEAFGRVRRSDWQLVVAGKGRIPWLRPAQVIFTGPLADMENAYAAADVLVLPPLYEPSANVVYEALAAGLPVITSRWNGAAEILEEEATGTVLPRSDDVPALAAAMLRWSHRRERVRVDAGRLSLENNVQQTLAILARAARERRQ
ncbi:glycosyltransferase family 4 protein [Fontisphaera persica]|uniref:glycosyltransferase family 4 protein n=1 Tax=Fontisphaera persica TaxID=2974023 RepID=UPI0024BFDC98|nr:glycosyltransferase family 4 protein [Fontisphaera persica]WCJ58118.1 glycosyltransferase family 4 protein [Fontisphaera persica]